jgi:hypothetical protein
MKKSLQLIFRIVVLSVLVVTLAACSDSVAPSISLDESLSYTIGDPAMNFDGVFSATDDEDGDVTASIVIDDNAVDYTTAGTYQVTVTAVDEAGNEASSNFDLTVSNETVAPVITGMQNVSIKQGEDTFDYLAGVTASDNLDGDITSSIVVDDSAVDYSAIGIYRVYYTVSDTAGNEASESINVNVTYETTAPTFDGLVDLTVGLDADLPDFLVGVTADDNFDGDITANIEVSYNTIDTSVLGTHTITYTVKDAANNETSSTVTLHVVDMTPPVIEGARDLSFKVFTNPDFLWRDIVVNDNIDGDILSNIVIDDSLVDMSVLGAYDLTYSATDAAGNTSTVTVTINVRDYAAPEFVVNNNIYYLDGDDDPVYLDYIQVIDNYDGDLTSAVVFDDTGVDLTTVGVYDISMTVVDSSGNTKTETLTLVVPSQEAVDNVNGDITNMVLPTDPILANLYLISLGVNGSNISWDSLTDSRLTDGGKILPPGIGEDDEIVTLIGTFTYDTYVRVVEYTITVAAKAEAAIDSKVTYDYIGIGEEWVTADSTLDAYYETGSVIPFVDVEDLFAVVDGAVYYEDFTFTFTDPILTVTFTYEYEDDEGIMQTEVLSADFNFDDNTVTSANADFFGSYMQSSSSSGTSFSGLSFEGVTIDGHEITYDLGYYGFDMVVYDDIGTNKYLVPFNVLQTLLFGPTYFDVYFNQDAFYGTEYVQLTAEGSDNMVTMQTSSVNNSNVPSELKLATYNYLAWTLDHYYGIKDVAGVDTYYSVLEPFIDNMIFSNDIDYYESIFKLVYYLDDPHTYFYYSGYYQPYNPSTDFVASFSDLGQRTASRNSDYWDTQDYYEDKYGSSIPTTWLLDDGKTAIIYVPTMSDQDAPDTVRAALDALPAGIENVILDIANNGGGWNSVTYQLMAIMTNDAFADHSMNPFDGSVSSYFITSENDAYDQYNWFVLTSPVSYSASSSLAAMAKEAGIPIIGLDAGGGASSVQLVQPFGGSIFVMSSNNVNSIRIFNEETQEYEYFSIEYGVEVDYEIIDFLNDDDLIAAINDILSQQPATE